MVLRKVQLRWILPLAAILAVGPSGSQEEQPISLSDALNSTKLWWPTSIYHAALTDHSVPPTVPDEQQREDDARVAAAARRAVLRRLARAPGLTLGLKRGGR
jgi:hypothetical protein